MSAGVTLRGEAANATSPGTEKMEQAASINCHGSQPYSIETSIGRMILSPTLKLVDVLQRSKA